MEAIENANPDLKGVLPRSYAGISKQFGKGWSGRIF
jgi:hypothetical protein